MCQYYSNNDILVYKDTLLFLNYPVTVVPDDNTMTVYAVDPPVKLTHDPYWCLLCHSVFLTVSLSGCYVKS